MNGGSYPSAAPHDSSAYLPSQTWGHLVVLFLLSCFLFLPRLGDTRLFDQDEGYYASVALEMHQRNDWILPTFNQELFAHKPPLMFWGMRMGFLLLGTNEIGARLGSALAGIFTVLVVHWIGKRLFDPMVGFIAGLALASNLMFSMVARSATADAYLTLFISASLGIWLVAYRGAHHPRPAIARLQAIPMRIWLVIYSGIGLAVLTKGPIGFLFPATIIGLTVYGDLVAERMRETLPIAGSRRRNILFSFLDPLRPRSIAASIRAVRPLLGLVGLAMIAGPWYYLAEVQSEGRFLNEFIGVHHLGRFSQAMDNHEGPFYYYFLACLMGLYPWSAFAIPVGIAWIHSLRSNDGTPEVRWISIWIAVYLGVFSMASTKLPNYVLPAYPAMVLCIGHYFRGVLRDAKRWNRWQSIAWAFLLLVGVLLTIGLAVVGWLGTNRIGPFGDLEVSLVVWEIVGGSWWIGLPLAIMGIAGILIQRQSGRDRLPFGFAIASALFLSLIWHVAAPKLRPWQAPQRLAKEVSTLTVGKSRTIRMLDMFRPSVVFYSGQPVEFTGWKAFVERERTRNTPAVPGSEILMLRRADWEKLREAVPGRFEVLTSVPNFPESDELIAVEGSSLLSKEK